MYKMNPFTYLYEKVYCRVTKRDEIIASKIRSLVVGKVLDIGCSDGRISAKVGGDMTGLDVLVPDKVFIPVMRYNGRNILCANNSFDTVLLIDTLHHADDPFRVLEEAKRVGKRIVIKDHYYENRVDLLVLSLFDWLSNVIYGRNIPLNFLTLREWSSLFSRLKLKIKHCEGFKLIRSPIKQVIYELEKEALM